jgi:hypothetical protein
MERITDELLKDLEEYVHKHTHGFEEVDPSVIPVEKYEVYDSTKYELGVGQTFKFYGGQVGEGAILEVNDMFGNGECWRVYTILDGDRGWMLSET